MSRTDDEKMREKFWKAMAEETGEEILSNALLRVIASEPEDLGGKWLLFFSTESSLYYKRFPNDSMMARLFNMARDEEYPLEGIGWDNIRCVREKKKGGFLSRIMGTPSAVEIRWGDEARFFVEMDRFGEELLKGRLEEA